MPSFLYNIPVMPLALLLFLAIEAIALGGLWLVRRGLQPRLRLHDGSNEAVSGTVQSIGVFYGITVGLIAVAVWNRHDAAMEVASHEAAAIGSFYRDVSMLPDPSRTLLREQVQVYTAAVVDIIWPAQRRGDPISGLGTQIVDEIQTRLTAFSPANEKEEILYTEALHSYNAMVEARRLRMDAVSGALSGVMWAVIWLGAAISIGVAYFFQLEDPKVHGAMIGLMAAFLALVIFMILINDRPFYGHYGIEPDSYVLVQQTLFASSR